MGHIHRDVVDKGLLEIALSANGILVCYGAPSTYADAVGMALGTKTFPAGTGFYAIGTVGNARQLSSLAISDGTGNMTGTAASWAVIDSATQRLLAANDMTPPLSIIKNTNWALPTFGIAMQGLPAASVSLSVPSKQVSLSTAVLGIGPNLTPTVRALAIAPGAAATAVVVINSPIMKMPPKNLLTKPQGQVVALMHLSSDISDATSRHNFTVDPSVQFGSNLPVAPKFGTKCPFFNDTGWNDGIDLDGVGTDFNLDGDFTIDFWFCNTWCGWQYAAIYQHSSLQPLSVSNIGWIGVTNYKGYIWANMHTAGGGSFADGAWHHCALTRKDFVMRSFFDGVLTDSTYIGTYNGIPLPGPGDGGVYDNINYIASAGYPKFGLQQFSGSIQELRIIKGWAAWTASFTPPSAPYTLTDFPVRGGTTVYPPSASLSLINNPLGHGMLMHFEKGLAEELGHTIQASGNVTIDAAHWIKFGANSIRVQNGWFGINDLTDDFQFGLNDFTIDFWLYLNSLTSAIQGIVDFRAADGSLGLFPTIRMNSSNVLIYATVDNTAKITGPTLAAATAYHIALTRQAGQTRMFVNGSQVGSTYADTNRYLSSGPGRRSWSCPVFGADAGNQTSSTNVFGIDGWFDEVRIINGWAAWAANFTPPTKQYGPGDIRNVPTVFVPLMITPPTVALTLRGGGRDNTRGVLMHFGSNFNDVLGSTVTPSSSAPTLDSAKLKFGVASGYFAGNTSCYLSILGSPNSKFDFPGDFTIDFWWMPQTSNTGGSVLHCWPTEAGAPNPFNLDYHDGFGFWTDGTINMWADGYSTWDFVGTTVLAVGNWYHIAVTRSGYQMKLFINGVSDTTPNYPFYGRGSTAAMTLGDGDGFANGWMAEFRILNGFAQWTSNFTPPTAPYTYIDPTTTIVAIH
jgi:hypothetical protein